MSDLDFLLISDPKIWAISVRECGEPMVDLRHFKIAISPDRAPFYNGFTRIRQEVANKLMLAQTKLPKGLAFLFSEGHRPIALQKEMYENYYQQLSLAHPTWDTGRLKIETVKYVAPPEDIPPHSTGGAFDITIIDKTGARLDMGTILDETPDKNQNRNFTYAADISGTAKKNRAILIEVLSGEGFVNYPAEWWHWSYGDKYWASCKGNVAIYGSVE